MRFLHRADAAGRTGAGWHAGAVGVGGAARADQDLLVCMVTYTLLASLTVTSFFSMPVTRFLADMLLAEREDENLPTYWGSNAIMIDAGTELYGVY